MSILLISSQPIQSLVYSFVLLELFLFALYFACGVCSSLTVLVSPYLWQSRPRKPLMLIFDHFRVFMFVFVVGVHVPLVWE